MYTLVHAVLGYFFLLLMVRILARRPGAQMTPFEFVLVFLVGGVIILATVGDDRSMTNCYGGVIIICMMHHLMGKLKQKSEWWGRIIDGTPIVLIKNDEWQTNSVNMTRVDDMDVMAAARSKGIKRLDQIKYAVLERNGSISIVKKET
jgi:uncharacterized membrane protein YcaP (DUF421 family)